MIMVIGWVRFESSSEVESFRAAGVEMMRATKASEPGCLEYTYAQDIAEPDLLRITEFWVDDAALTTHFATPHMAAMSKAMAGAKVTAMSVKVYAGEVVRTLLER